jgi:hypothetical protein
MISVLTVLGAGTIAVLPQRISVALIGAAFIRKTIADCTDEGDEASKEMFSLGTVVVVLTSLSPYYGTVAAGAASVIMALEAVSSARNL